MTIRFDATATRLWWLFAAVWIAWCLSMILVPAHADTITWYVVSKATGECVPASNLTVDYPKTSTTPEVMLKVSQSKGWKVEQEIFRDPPLTGKHIRAIVQSITDKHGKLIGDVGWFDSVAECKHIQCISSNGIDIPGDQPRPPHHNCPPP
jgi:hypothetical protein